MHYLCFGSLFLLIVFELLFELLLILLSKKVCLVFHFLIFIGIHNAKIPIVIIVNNHHNNQLPNSWIAFPSKRNRLP